MNTACTLWAASGTSACGASVSVEGQPSAPCYSCPNNLGYTWVLATFSAVLFQVIQPSIPVLYTLHFNHTKKKTSVWIVVKIALIINAMFRCDKWKHPFRTSFHVNQVHCIINYLCVDDTLTFTSHKCSHSVGLPFPLSRSYFTC